MCKMTPTGVRLNLKNSVLISCVVTELLRKVFHGGRGIRNPPLPSGKVEFKENIDFGFEVYSDQENSTDDSSGMTSISLSLLSLLLSSLPALLLAISKVRGSQLYVVAMSTSDNNVTNFRCRHRQLLKIQIQRCDVTSFRRNWWK